MGIKLYEHLEDKDIIKKVNEVFYEKVYEHPWLSLYFKDVDQEFITDQQTHFIVQAIGGPSEFSGRLPSNAHPHMFITDELMDIREDLLREAFDEVNAPQSLRDAWIRIDESFRKVIVKKSPHECSPRFNSDEYLIFENPEKDKKKAA